MIFTLLSPIRSHNAVNASEQRIIKTNTDICEPSSMNEYQSTWLIMLIDNNCQLSSWIIHHQSSLITHHWWPMFPIIIIAADQICWHILTNHSYRFINHSSTIHRPFINHWSMVDLVSYCKPSPIHESLHESLHVTPLWPPQRWHTPRRASSCNSKLAKPCKHRAVKSRGLKGQSFTVDIATISY